MGETKHLLTPFEENMDLKTHNIVAAFGGMHVSLVKQSSV